MDTRSPIFACRFSTLFGAALLAAALFFAALSASAQQSAPPDADAASEDLSRASRDAIDALNRMIGPMIESLSSAIDDLPAFRAPEVLPNGDILIRRKHPHDPAPRKLPDGRKGTDT